MEDEACTEIMDATYRALRKHGYATLTLRDIASETTKSKSTICYHYDTKDDLLTAFLDDRYDKYTSRIETVSGETASEQLRSLLEVMLPVGDEADVWEYRTAMLGIEAQAPYDERIRNRLAEFDRYLFERLRDILAAGVETDEFASDVDPSELAEFLVTALRGAQTRQVTGDHTQKRFQAALTGYLESQLIAAAPAEGVHS